jgi:integrase
MHRQADVAFTREFRAQESGGFGTRMSQGRSAALKAGRKSDANTLLDKLRREVLQQKVLPERYRARVTFGTLCDDALEHSRATNDAKVTYDLELKVERLRPEFGDKEASAITKQDIVRWLTSESEKRTWKPSTRNRWQAAFSLIYRVGMENEKTDRNPAAGIRRKSENNAVVRYLSATEEESLRAVIERRFPQYMPQLDLSLYTGMRAGEQFGLMWNQVDFERQMLALPKTKNGTVRHIKLHAEALAALVALKGDGTGAVFPTTRGDGERLQRQEAGSTVRSRMRGSKLTHGIAIDTHSPVDW